MKRKDIEVGKTYWAVEGTAEWRGQQAREVRVLDAGNWKKRESWYRESTVEIDGRSYQTTAYRAEAGRCVMVEYVRSKGWEQGRAFAVLPQFLRTDEENTAAVEAYEAKIKAQVEAAKQRQASSEVAQGKATQIAEALQALGIEAMGSVRWSSTVEIYMDLEQADLLLALLKESML